MHEAPKNAIINIIEIKSANKRGGKMKIKLIKSIILVLLAVVICVPSNVYAEVRLYEIITSGDNFLKAQDPNMNTITLYTIDEEGNITSVESLNEDIINQFPFKEMVLSFEDKNKIVILRNSEILKRFKTVGKTSSDIQTLSISLCCKRLFHTIKAL